MSSSQSAPSASAEPRRLKVFVDSCGDVPRNPKKIYAYYVSFILSPSVRVESRTHPISAQGAVVWAEELYFDFPPSSSCEVHLYEVRRLRADRMIAKSTVNGLSILSANQISLTLPDDATSAACELRLTASVVQDTGRAEMNQAVSAATGVSLDAHTYNAALEIGGSGSTPVPAVTPVSTWGALFKRMQVVANIVREVAELHPYSKLAWGVISAGYELARKQNERDENVTKLIEALCSAYDIVLGMDGLESKIAAQVKTIGALTRSTITCGHFIESYLKKGFWGRVVRDILSSTDKEIDEFVAQFEQIQKNLATFNAIATQHHVQVILGNTERIVDTVHLARMPFTATARWRSGRKCLPGTRTDMISRILDWAHLSTDDAPRILLMSGVAGVGKSSIANTIASHLQDMSCLAASYCFDRSNAREHRPELLIPTIAHQLASAYPAYKHTLASMNGPDALTTPDMDDQFENLLRAPLAEQTFAGPLFVVVDALDESANRMERAKLLSILADRFVELPPQVRIMLTSRPEEDIQDVFGGSEHVQIIHLSTDDNDDDIKAFVASKLVDRRGSPLVEFSSADHAVLASKAEGLFQWAAVVCASIMQGKNPNLRPSARQMRETYERFVSLSSGALDALYSETLLRLFPEPSEDDELLARILGLIVATQQPLSAASIFELLQIPEDEQELCLIMLQSLGALLSGVLNQDEPIRTLHSSFRDYLYQSRRGQRFYVDQDLIHCDASIGCLRVLNKGLRFNICGLETSYVANEDIADLAQKMSEHVPPVLAYAAQFWGHHIQSAEACPFGFVCELEILLREKFLFWIELLSLLNAVAAAAPALRASSSHITTDTLQPMLADYVRFVRTFGQAITRATPHVYLSAYAFAPTRSLTYQQPYSQRIQHLPKLTNKRTSWPPLDLFIRGHPGSGRSIAFSPDGRHIASSSEDDKVHIWDAETGTAVGSPLEGHKWWVSSVTYSPDGRRIVSGSWDTTVRIWDAETRAAVGAPLRGHKSLVTSVVYAQSGRRIMSGSEDMAVCIWDAETGASIGTFADSTTQGVFCVAFSPDGRRVASGARDETVRMWDVETGTAVGTPLTGHTKIVHSVAFSPDNLRLASGSWDGTVRIWDAETGVAVGAPFIGHTYYVSSVAYSPDGRRVVSGSMDGTVRIWDAETGNAIGAPLKSHPGPTTSGNPSGITSVVFSSDGRRIAAGSYDSTILIWDAETEVTASPPLEGHTGGVICAVYSPDGCHIASGSYDRTVRIWNAKTGQAVCPPLTGHTSNVYSVAYSPDGRRIVSGSEDKTVRIWDVESGTAIGTPLEGHTSYVHSVVYSPDGRQILSGAHDRTARIWDAETGSALGLRIRDAEMGRILAGRSSPTGINELAYSPDGRRIVSGAFDNMVRIWDAETGAALGAPFEGHTYSVESVAYSPNGRRIVSSSTDRTVRVWDAETGTEIRVLFEGHKKSATSAVFSPDGHQVAFGSFDQMVRVVDAETGSVVGVPLEGHTKFVSSVAYSPDGRYLVSTSADNTIRIWNINELDANIRSRTFSSDEQHALPNYPCQHSTSTSSQVQPGLQPPVFRLMDSGWIEDVSCHPPKLLLWIPIEHRRALYLPPMSLIISPFPTHSLDLSDFAHGARWVECYEDQH